MIEEEQHDIQSVDRAQEDAEKASKQAEATKTKKRGGSWLGTSWQGQKRKNLT